ncbi:hypothetical protein ACEWY4_003655 [Coilia grayii]|uniref:Myb/SANT-like DNA-binding domain-containing protein n=1 Tax=Coilia grayii TaxID=363190 RepID=A0ABD1KRU9_9TELE
MADQVPSATKEMHKWTVEQTKGLIAFRVKNQVAFTKKKFASKQLWEVAVKQLGLEGRVTGQQASKKWENLKMKYRKLRGPTTGSGTDEGEETAATWRYFEEMHAALGGKPAIDPPVLVYPKKDPVPMLMAMIEPQFTSGNKDAGGGTASSTSAATSSSSSTTSAATSSSSSTTSAATTSSSSTSAATTSSSSTTPAAAPPCKRARSNADVMLEFLKAEAAKEQRRYEQSEANTNRFLSLFEKLVDKIVAPEQ